MAKKKLYCVSRGKNETIHATEKQPDIRAPYARNGIIKTKCGKEFSVYAGEYATPHKNDPDCKGCLKAIAS